MANQPMGKQSFVFENPPVITAWASVAGKREANGPLGKLIDLTVNDPYFGQKTWELAEKKLQKFTISYVKQCKEGETIQFYRKYLGDGNYLTQGFNEADEMVVQAQICFKE